MARRSVYAVVLIMMCTAFITLSALTGPATASESRAYSAPTSGGHGTHELVADPRRPLVYQVGAASDFLLFLNASTGEPRWNESLIVGPSPASIDLSSDGNFLYVAVAGANQTVLVDIDTRAIVRTIPLNFSPLSVRHGRPDRLYVSEAGAGIVRIVNETTGAVINSLQPYGPFDALLDVSPDGSELLVHLRSSPVWLFRYSIATDDPTLIASDSQSQGDPDNLIVDWPARAIYFSSFVPYGVEVISLDTLLHVQDFWTNAYPAGIAFLSDRHLVFGVNSYGYDSALWAFNLDNGSLARRVPIGTDPWFVIASPFAGTVLVGSPYGTRAIALAPSVSPQGPAPDTTATQYPYFVTARVWTGIPIVTIDRAEIHVNSRALQTSFSRPDILQGYADPHVPVGVWHIAAEIAWANGSTAATWTATIAPPTPVAGFDQHPSDPLFAGQTIHFDGRVSVAQAGTITDYEWNFGDGSTGTGPMVDVIYQRAGAYDVTLTIRTDIGDSDTGSARLLVEAFPELTLVPHDHPAGFRAVAPSTWNVSENVPVGSSVVEFVFRGPRYARSPTTVSIDAHRDPAANETVSYLDGRLELFVNELRNLAGTFVVTEPATPRTVAGREGRMIVAWDTYRGIAYKMAVVASTAQGQWWSILLTLDADYLSAYEPMFDRMLDGFEITLMSAGPPASPTGSGTVIGVAAIAGVAAGVVGVWCALRVRRKRNGSGKPRDSEEKPLP